jgi:hypothetical protein
LSSGVLFTFFKIYLSYRNIHKGKCPEKTNVTIFITIYDGDNTLAHIPDRRLHDCAQFTCILVLRLRALLFKYTCIINYVCAHLKFYISSEQYFLHLYRYDLYRTGEYYLIYIIHSEMIWKHGKICHQQKKTWLSIL